VAAAVLETTAIRVVVVQQAVVATALLRASLQSYIVRAFAFGWTLTKEEDPPLLVRWALP
jgi:hypothetical protein